jgi:hypothetical protein
MIIILDYSTGRLEEGLLLAIADGRIRVVLRRLNETVEFRESGTRWISELGEQVEIESMIFGELAALDRPAAQTAGAWN